MSTRREFLTQTATALVTARSIQLASPTNQKAVPKPSKVAPNVMRQAGSPIKSVICREETTLRLGGHGAEWHMSWAADDRQFVSLGGGMGWSDNPERVYISRLLAISNGPQDATFQDISGYPGPSATVGRRERSTALYLFRYDRSGRAHLSVPQHARAGNSLHTHKKFHRYQAHLFAATAGAPGVTRMGRLR